MRIREAMRVAGAQPIGGEGKIIGSDETFVGGKKKNVHKGKPEPKSTPCMHWSSVAAKCASNTLPT